MSRWQRAGEGAATLLKLLFWMLMLANVLTGSAGGGHTWLNRPGVPLPGCQAAARAWTVASVGLLIALYRVGTDNLIRRE
ncbi:hypothetical protein DVH21_16670 [Micromonospora aurantiaca]|uniref:Uncharacterized protein n=1 Tax=Micromonospora aurantiaca (nom. illeg.) TaxID=47850 RepID=A0A6N3K0H9_9ACTN|nr:hypothetical protein DVH21_16670 [Micromonospora aurantiaca]